MSSEIVYAKPRLALATRDCTILRPRPGWARFSEFSFHRERTLALSLSPSSRHPSECPFFANNGTDVPRLILGRLARFKSAEPESTVLRGWSHTRGPGPGWTISAFPCNRNTRNGSRFALSSIPECSPRNRPEADETRCCRGRTLSISIPVWDHATVTMMHPGPRARKEREEKRIRLPIPCPRPVG